MTQLRQQYGDVVRIWAGQSIVLCFDPDLYLQVLRQEWSLPHGAAPETWPLVQYYQSKTTTTSSSSTMPMMLKQGQEWKTARQDIQKHLFKQQVADEYQPLLTAVTDDAIAALRDMASNGTTTTDLNQFLIHASFEMLAHALLKRRMGLIDNTSGLAEREFVQHAVQAFHALGPLITQPPFFPRWFNMMTSSTYRTFDQSMDKVWDIGMEFLQQAEKDDTQSWKGSMFAKLTQDGTMERQERLVNLVTLLQAGVDTTSNTLEWIIYQLAKHPEQQERVRKELQQVMPPDSTGFRRELLSQMPYFKAFLREVQRVTPTASGNIRRIPYPVEIGPYQLEKNSMIFWEGWPYGQDAALLGDDPTVFAPERWLVGLPKDAPSRQPVAAASSADGTPPPSPAPILSHPLLTTPFGVGPRMCVGARLAQNEIHTFISAVVLNFELSLDPPDQGVRSQAMLVNTPQPSPRIRIEPVPKS